MSGSVPLRNYGHSADRDDRHSVYVHSDNAQGRTPIRILREKASPLYPWITARYDLRSPTYEAEERSWEILFGSENEETAVIEEESNPYAKNKMLLLYFDDSTWDTLSIQERITIAQEFVDFQSQLLGIPTIPVTTKIWESLSLANIVI